MNMSVGGLQKQHENWKAARERLFNPAVKPIIKASAVLAARRIPMWRICDMYFDAHVRQYQKLVRDFMAELAAEMRAGQDENSMMLNKPSNITPARDIVEDVLQHFPGITLADLKGQRKARCYTVPRQIAMYQLSVRRKDMSLPMIGRFFGNRDHTTALHAIRKIRALVESGELKLPFVEPAE
jgi:chromosomal replication initiator protein